MKNQVVIGSKSTNSVMGEPITTEKRNISVNDFLGVFTIKYGPLVFGGHTYEKTFVLEIDYKDAEKTQRELLGVRTYGNFYAMIMQKQPIN